MKQTIRRIAIFMAAITLFCSLNVTAFASEIDTPTKEVKVIDFYGTEFEKIVIVPDENLHKPEITKVPLFNQMFYDDEPYGDYGTIASHGCGITCVAMIATYWTNTIYAPEVLAEQFGHYNTPNGSYWTLFEDSAKELGIGFDKQCYTWSEAKEALENGQLVVCLQDVGLFTGGGHFIVLTGINEEGKVVVNDPNGYNWTKNDTMIEGFKNGFTEKQIYQDACAYFVYEAKPAVG